MRSVKYTLAFASLGGLLAVASCTLITDVDRSKIPTGDGSGGDAGAASGGASGGAGKKGVGGDSAAGDTGFAM